MNFQTAQKKGRTLVFFINNAFAKMEGFRKASIVEL